MKNKQNRIKNSSAIHSINEAYAHFTAGNSQTALHMCDGILNQLPGDINALNLTGIILDSQNNKVAAILFFKKAVDLAPDNTNIRNNLANSYLDTGDLKNAEINLTKVVSIETTNIQAWLNLVNIARQNKQQDMACRYAESANKFNPNQAIILIQLGKLAYLNKEFKTAEKYFSIAVTSNNISLPILNQLADYFIQQNIEHELIQIFRKILTFDEYNIRANRYIGLNLMSNTPGSEAGLHHLLKVYAKQTEVSMINLDIAKTYIHQGKLDEAKRYVVELFVVQPDHADTLNTLGIISQNQGGKSDAIEYYRRAININPNYADAHSNLGLILQQNAEYQQALFHYHKAISLNSNNQITKHNLALLELLLKDYQNGWKNYCTRPNLAHQTGFDKRQNFIDDFRDKSILISKEQGIGDELFFLRFLSQFNKINRNTTYRSSEKLFPLLQPLNLCNVICTEPNLTEYDMHINIGDLPFILSRTERSNQPTVLPLITNSQKIEALNLALHKIGPPPYIGITWRAGGIVNNMKTSSYYKEIPLDKLISALPTNTGSVIILQNNISESEWCYLRKNVKGTIIDGDQYYHDLEMMLAMMELLDQYVAVSNTNIHLRAGLNKSSHVLICTPPEWRWQTGETSQWFPQHHLYRQSNGGNWNGAIKQLRQHLNDKPTH